MQVRHHLMLVLGIPFLYLSHAVAQQDCCEKAHVISNVTPNWTFSSSEDRNCAENEYQDAIANRNGKRASTCLYVLAIDAVNKFDDNKAINYFENFPRELLLDEQSKEVFNAHESGVLGYINDQRGYQKTAIKYTKNAIDAYKRLGMDQEVLLHQTSLVKLLAQRGSYEEAIALGKMVVEKTGVLSDEGRGSELKGAAANNLGYAYIYQGLNYRSDMRASKTKEAGHSAFEILKNNLEYAKKPGMKDLGLFNIANAALVMEEWDTARYYVDQIGLPYPHKFAISAIINMKAGRFNQAFSEISTACKAASLVSADESDALGQVIIQYPDAGDWADRAFIWIYLLETKGNILMGYYRTHPDSVSYLEKSFSAFEQALEIYQRLQAEFLDDGSPELRARFQNTHSSAALCAAELYLASDSTDQIKKEKCWSKAFSFAEQNQAFLLREGILNSLEGRCDSISTISVDCRAKALRDSLFAARKQRNAKEERLKRQEYIVFINSLRNSVSPAERQFYERRFGQMIVEVDSLQYALIPDSALFIEYVWSAPKPFALWATSKSKGIVPLGITMANGDSIGADIETFQEQWLRDDVGGFQSLNTSLGHQLYRTFLFVVLNDVPIEERNDLNRLIIVPDNVLRTLPFDVLLTDSALDEDHKLHYVLNRFIVNYQYSATLWALQREQLNRRKRVQISIGCFVNKNDQTGCADELLKNISNFAQDSLKAIILASRNTLRIFQNASINDFEQFAPQFDVMFFGVHGCINKDPDASYLSLYSNNIQENKGSKLSISNLYAREEPLKAQLAVFGSCETARQEGEHEVGNKGEGVIGLHWAMSYAGCPNVVASLNSVRDKSTAALMQLFFNNLLVKKMPTDESLTQAKRQYLETRQELVLPVYWANFICIGPSVQFR